MAPLIVFNTKRCSAKMRLLLLMSTIKSRLSMKCCVTGGTLCDGARKSCPCFKNMRVPIRETVESWALGGRL